METNSNADSSLIKPTIFPFNINPKDYSNNAFDELQQIANKYGVDIVLIKDEKVRYTGSFMQLYFDGMSNLRYLKTHGLSMLNYIYRNIKFDSNWIVLKSD